jgi:hypothetical protein
MAVYNSRLYAGTFNYPDGAEVWEYAPDPGELDPGFGTGGVVIYDGGNDDAANGVAIQPDNKIVVAGYTYNEV